MRCVVWLFVTAGVLLALARQEPRSLEPTEQPHRVRVSELQGELQPWAIDHHLAGPQDIHADQHLNG
jgi:hypothetical protein